MNSSRLASLLLMVLGIPCFGAGAFSKDWNQFRGPNGSGIAEGDLSGATAGTNSRIWKTPLPPGHSSPVLHKGRLFITAVDKDRLVTLALDTDTGKILWRQEAPPVPLQGVHATSSPAASTPWVDDSQVYVYFGSFGLLCYDHAGRERWKKPMPTPKSLYGSATSPIAHGDNLILVVDDETSLPDSKVSRSALLAVKKASGEVAWETPRPLHRSGWSTPALVNYDGGQELVVLGSGRACGYDPVTGAEKWFVTGFSRETIAMPIAGNGLVYLASSMLGGVPDEQPNPEPFWMAMLRFDTNKDGRIQRGEMNRHFTFPFRPELPVDHPGFGSPMPDDPEKRTERQGRLFDSIDKDKDGVWTREEFITTMSFKRGKPKLLAVKPGGNGDIATSQVAWELNRNIPEVPSPLLYENRLYLVRDGGLLCAVDASTGTVLYTERLGAAGQYTASPVVAGSQLVLISNPGIITVAKTGDKFEIIRQWDLGEPAHVTPSFDAKTMYVRTEKHLSAFRTR